eukprot:scaffold25288_cov112-Isochrysis_galbana.AAC.6
MPSTRTRAARLDSMALSLARWMSSRSAVESQMSRSFEPWPASLPTSSVIRSSADRRGPANTCATPSHGSACVSRP